VEEGDWWIGEDELGAGVGCGRAREIRCNKDVTKSRDWGMVLNQFVNA